jgi:hypothetical protein
MKKAERAAQIWPLLTLCASRGMLLAYEELSELIGVPPPGLGQLLEPIQSYCILKHLPALTSLVVSSVSGLPGEGFIAAADVPEAQARVFEYKWMGSQVPGPEELEAAVVELPSNGRSLTELLAKIKRKK